MQAKNQEKMTARKEKDRNQQVALVSCFSKLYAAYFLLNFVFISKLTNWETKSNFLALLSCFWVRGGGRVIKKRRGQTYSIVCTS
jgi:hypothetical protein